ncbi:hypothetical protein I4U23_012323 [Adineta vaga]|nr:hypothetical protein I4U23_012323 [Adineta vaga]
MHSIHWFVFLFLSIFASVIGVRIYRFDRAVIFGDSLTDTGNVYKLTNYTWPISPYYQGRFCNGPNWVDRVNISEKLNYAFAGGTTDNAVVQGYSKSLTVPVPGLRQQISSYINSSSSTMMNFNRTMYILWAGGNDLVYNPTMNSSTFVNSYLNAVKDLIALGGQNFLIFNAPPIQIFPYFSRQNKSAYYISLTNAVNTDLTTGINALKTTYPNISLQKYDVYTLFTKIMANQSFPFSNTVDRCWDVYNFTAVAVFCQDPSTYIFLDSFHVTSTIHQLIADEINPFLSYNSNSIKNRVSLNIFLLLTFFLYISNK